MKGSHGDDALHADDYDPPGPLPHCRRSPDPLRRQRWLAWAGAPAHQSLAGERVRVRAHVGGARRARPAVRRRPAGVRRLPTPGGPPVPQGHGRVPGPAHRRGRPRHAPHRRAGRRDLGRPVRRGRASGADRRCDRRHGRSFIDAGHFVWEEAPAEYASIILDSILW